MMNKELIFLRTFAITTAAGILWLSSTAFTNSKNQRFTEIDVERINIIEPNGTVKMVITNTQRFPTGTDSLNNRPVNPDRKKRSGMLFFNEDGIEAGGFIYDGKKTANGHSSGLSLTYDQYDGDQVMQLLTTDSGKGDNRFVSSTLAFNDRPKKESQLKTIEIMKELEALKLKDPKLMEAKYKEYEAQGLLGGVPRIMLGKSRSENNGLFLFDDQGMPRAMFYVDKQNNAKLDFFNEKGEVIASFPDQKK